MSTVDASLQLARNVFFQDAGLILNAHEREFLERMRQGEKRKQIFIEILARHGLSTSNPEHEVKNTKERLIRKLRSIANDQGYTLDDLVG